MTKVVSAVAAFAGGLIIGRNPGAGRGLGTAAEVMTVLDPAEMHTGSAPVQERANDQGNL